MSRTELAVARGIVQAATIYCLIRLYGPDNGHAACGAAIAGLFATVVYLWNPAASGLPNGKPVKGKRGLLLWLLTKYANGEIR